MRHRLYYLHPDIQSAHRTLDDLLLARIEERHIRFMSDGRPVPADLPEASVLHKTDLLHGAALGMLFGAGFGLGLAFLIVNYLELNETRALVFMASTIIGWNLKVFAILIGERFGKASASSFFSMK